MLRNANNVIENGEKYAEKRSNKINLNWNINIYVNAEQIFLSLRKMYNTVHEDFDLP